MCHNDIQKHMSYEDYISIFMRNIFGVPDSVIDI